MARLIKHKLDIDAIEVGMIVNIRFYPLMDENFFSQDFYPDVEERHKKIKKEGKKAITFPALIIKKYKRKLGPPVFDVILWQRTNYYELSGTIKLKKICIWRYFDSPEMIPPKWLLSLLDKELIKKLEKYPNKPNKYKKLKFAGVPYKKLHYVVNNKLYSNEDNYFKHYIYQDEVKTIQL